MFMKRNLMKITIMNSDSGHISSVFAYTRLIISHWTEVVIFNFIYLNGFSCLRIDGRPSRMVFTYARARSIPRAPFVIVCAGEPQPPTHTYCMGRWI